jgi:ADP-heptose:LPS heptosyltransferase
MDPAQQGCNPRRNQLDGLHDDDRTPAGNLHSMRKSSIASRKGSNQPELAHEASIKSFIDPKIDCRHYRGDRPCGPHKREHVACDRCPHYDPCSLRILIVKLAADGDVLRTTCLLPSLRKAYPTAQITWITEKSAEPLLRNNPFIDRIWAPPERYLVHLLNERFELVINTDAESSACHLAALAKAPRKRGFVGGRNGTPLPQNLAAERWFQMGLWDHLKRANEQTYPAIIHQIAGVPDIGSPPLLHLTAEEIGDARRILAKKGWKLPPGEVASRASARAARPVIGINTGAGARWPQKALPLKSLEEVISRLLRGRNPPRILLLGGPAEMERNRYLAARFPGRVLDTGTNHSLRQFAALISQIQVLLTADTLALHVGLALRKHVIVHFGPTSPSEIELYGCGEKIIPATDSGSCYCNECPKTPKCNELIAPIAVTQAIVRGISASVRSDANRVT